MKYVLLFCGTREQQQAWEDMSEEARSAQYAQVGRWFAENSAKLGAGNQLQSPHMATTVRFQGEGEPILRDGPFIEGNEVIGGYIEINVADLDEDAAWLTTLVTNFLPREPEPLGLLALMRLHLARSEARFTSTGELVLLSDQDRSLWNRSMIAEAIVMIEQAAVLRRPGPYQIEAAIVACHAEAESLNATDWQQIIMLYDLPLQMAPSPVVRLNRAVALQQVAGPEAALAEVNALERDLDNYHLYHAIRGKLLVELGQRELARASALRALELTENRAERGLLTRRLLEW